MFVRKINPEKISAAVIAVLSIAMSAAFSQSSGAQKSIVSTVTSVTVYSDRAAITRVGQAEVPAGTYFLSFNNLPVSLFDNSVRVSGHASSALIRDVRTKTVFLDTIPEAQVSSLQSQLDNVKTQIREVSDRDSVLEAEKDFIFQIKPQPAVEKNAAAPRGNVEEWQKAISFFDATLNKIYSELRK
ncbi:MAG: DUF4140 domain-containing protein, partial [Bacteroidota bacterium]|nr:DUF4140 domain-containing protein [Bacteroidota bacterium]